MKLTQIPKVPAVPTVVEPKEEKQVQLDESAGVDDDIVVFGMDPSDPGYQEEYDRLKRLKKTDNALFRKIQSMD